jgi:hypothetical protein
MTKIQKIEKKFWITEKIVIKTIYVLFVYCLISLIWLFVHFNDFKNSEINNIGLGLGIIFSILLLTIVFNFFYGKYFRKEYRLFYNIK